MIKDSLHQTSFKHICIVSDIIYSLHWSIVANRLIDLLCRISVNISITICIKYMFYKGTGLAVFKLTSLTSTISTLTSWPKGCETVTSKSANGFVTQALTLTRSDSPLRRLNPAKTSGGSSNLLAKSYKGNLSSSSLWFVKRRVGYARTENFLAKSFPSPFSMSNLTQT